MALNKTLKWKSSLNGILTIDLQGNVSWTNRFIVITDGVRFDVNNGGFREIRMPTTPVAVAGGAPRALVAASGILTGGIVLNAFEALWYRLPIEDSISGTPAASLTANFIIVPFQATFDADENWVKVIERDDRNTYTIENGDTFTLGDSSGPKDINSVIAAKMVETTMFRGHQWIGPVLGAASTYGFSDFIRQQYVALEGVERRGALQFTPPAVGTSIYDSNGNAIAGRSWRLPVAADRYDMFGDLNRSTYGINFATSTIVDILNEETLWFVPNPVTGGTTGNWVITPQSPVGYNGAGFSVPQHWILMCRRGAINKWKVHGGHTLLPGDIVAHDELEAMQAAQIRTSIASAPTSAAMCAWTPQPFFGAATGANGGASSTYGMFVKWSGQNASYAGISDTWTPEAGMQFIGLVMPPAGTAIPVLNNTGQANTRVVDAVMGVPLAAHEILWYIPPTSVGGTTSVANGWVVSSWNTAHVVPRHAIKVAQMISETTGPNGAISSAPPFAGVTINGNIGAYMWFLGQQLEPGVFTPTAAVGNLGTIGTTEGWRAPTFGAAGGATGFGNNVQAFGGGFAPGYRITRRSSDRTLRLKGLIGIATAGNATAGSILMFLPGVRFRSSHLKVVAANTGLTPTFTFLDLRFNNVAFGGINGAQLSIASVSGSPAFGTNGWIDLRSLGEEISLD